MDKEMKKLLLVAVSVGVFLLVTITAAILIVTPKVSTQEAAFTSSRPITAGRVLPVQPVPDVIEDNPPQTVINNNVEANIYNNRENPETAAVDRNEGDRLTIQIPKPTTAAVPDASEPPPSASQPAVVATVKPASKPAATPAQTQAPKATAQPAAAPKPAATPAKPAPAKAINDYWVQTGAFIAKIRAEDAKETLASKGITSIVENRQVNGQTWYRVRLGPYTSEKEANYWLALVKAIDGFGESQIRQTIRQQ